MQTTFIKMHRSWAIYECDAGFYLISPSGEETEPIYQSTSEAVRAINEEFTAHGD